ncbi:unnamed protein product [Laminaria digitata]
MNLLLDTNIVSVFLKSNDTRAAIYGPLIQGHQLHISFMTVAELYRWAHSKNWGAQRTQRLGEHIQRCTILPASHEVCLRWARVQAHRGSIGRPISSNDAWIAATALHYGLGLVTHNLKDFVELPELVLVTPADNSDRENL